MVRRAAVLLLALLALGAAAAGCGGPSKKEFGHDFRPLNDRVVALGREVGTALSQASRRSDAQIARRFGDLARRTGRLRQDVDALEPPDDLESTKNDLVKAMGDARDALQGISDAARSSDAPAATRASLRLLDASDKLRAARRKLARETGAKLD